MLGTYALHGQHWVPVEGWAGLWPAAPTHGPVGEQAAADDEAEARAALTRRKNSAAVTTLGQIATIHTVDGVYGRDAGRHDQAEVDEYPWTDAVRWRPDGGADELADVEAAVITGAALEESSAAPAASSRATRAC